MVLYYVLVISICQCLSGSSRVPSLPNITIELYKSLNKSLYVFTPPLPIKRFSYKCDTKFHLDILLDLYNNYDRYGLALISGSRCEFYFVSKNEIKLVRAFNEDLPNQHKTGGQSAQRFERIRDERILWYTKKIAETLTKLFVEDNICIIKGLIIGGPAEMKNRVSALDSVKQYFKKLTMIDTEEINTSTIHSIKTKLMNIINANNDQKDKLNELDETIELNPDLVMFGNEVLDELNEYRIIYIDRSAFKSNEIDRLMSLAPKTEFVIIDRCKFGNIVGIRYY